MRASALPAPALVRWRLPVAAGVLFAYVAYFLILHPPPGFPGSMDFAPWWVAGRLVLDGRAAQIYDLAAQSAYQRQLTYPFETPGGALVYNRPPFFTYVFIPLAWLPYGVGYALWVATVVVEGALAIWLIVTRVYPTRRPAAGVWLNWLIVSLAFYPVFQGILLGQTALLELLLLTSFYLLYRQGRTGAAGVVLALLAFKPQTVLFFLLVLLLRREWRALAASAATGAVLLVLSFALVGAQGLIAYAQTLNQVAQWICTNGVHLEMHQSLRGLFVGLLVPRCSLGQSESAMAPALAQADLLANVLSLAVALSLLAIWWRWRKARADSPQFDLAFAATGLAALLASPYVHPQDLTQLVLTLALVLRAGRALPVGRVPTPLPVAGWVGLALLLGPLTMTPAAFSLHPFVLFMAAMYVLLAYALLRPAPTAVTVGADRAER